ncbi:MAG: SGNH/GDSL hydrolase family protein [Planctomycetaceae bacterium]
MSRAASSGHLSHPLAGRSRRRRVLLVPAVQASLAEPEPAAQQTGLQTAVSEGRLDSGIDLQTLGEHNVAPSSDTQRFPQSHGDLQYLKRRVRSPQGLTWVFAGDSISMGASHTQGSRSFCEFFTERMRWELGRQLDVMINTSVAGETSRGLFHNLAQRVLRFPTDVVSLMIGLNDARQSQTEPSEFHDNLEQIIHVLRDHEILPLLQTPNGVGRLEDARRLTPFVDKIRGLATHYGLACIDHWDHWSIAAANRGVLQSWLDSDGLHPNSRGHREMAKLMFSQLDVFDFNSPSCRDD